MPPRFGRGRKAGGKEERFHPKLMWLHPLGDGVNTPTVFGGLTFETSLNGVTYPYDNELGRYVIQLEQTAWAKITPTAGAISGVSTILLPFSILFRVKPSTSGTVYGIYTNETINLEGSGPFNIAVYYQSTAIMKTSGTPVVANAWNSVAIVRNTSKSWSAYVNGTPATLSNNNTTQDFYVGYVVGTSGLNCFPIIGSPSGGFAGGICDFRIYKTNLGIDDINQEFNKKYI